MLSFRRKKQTSKNVADTTFKMKENVEKEYFCRIKELLKSKLNPGNVVKAINSRAVALI